MCHVLYKVFVQCRVQRRRPVTTTAEQRSGSLSRMDCTLVPWQVRVCVCVRARTHLPQKHTHPLPEIHIGFTPTTHRPCLFGAGAHFRALGLASQFGLLLCVHGGSELLRSRLMVPFDSVKAWYASHLGLHTIHASSHCPESAFDATNPCFPRLGQGHRDRLYLILRKPNQGEHHVCTIYKASIRASSVRLIFSSALRVPQLQKSCRMYQGGGDNRDVGLQSYPSQPPGHLLSV
mmetsp:Transcript_45555/g.74392  ORF Transcript_45555/g.74392 Transcript_45555/m.74392 type:complete len:234 (-) Transcript_45555:245-946(-)